jgi:hypothetical protein
MFLGTSKINSTLRARFEVSMVTIDEAELLSPEQAEKVVSQVVV